MAQVIKSLRQKKRTKKLSFLGLLVLLGAGLLLPNRVNAAVCGDCYKCIEGTMFNCKQCVYDPTYCATTNRCDVPCPDGIYPSPPLCLCAHPTSCESNEYRNADGVCTKCPMIWGTGCEVRGNSMAGLMPGPENCKIVGGTKCVMHDLKGDYAVLEDCYWEGPTIRP